ncbi:hypothetical protein Zm00014a_013504 [Zea mays]|uniref:Uncharacterized protein n=1 Tax=Zea mays TaxID=4577 RepID=A0A317Y3J7_MAIZE|nr:hypothetical protein Zm00014a_013504 [Zea mays]
MLLQLCSKDSMAWKTNCSYNLKPGGYYVRSERILTSEQKAYDSRYGKDGIGPKKLIIFIFCMNNSLLRKMYKPDAPGIEDVRDTELPRCGCDFSLRTRNAAMVVACAARARQIMRTRGKNNPQQYHKTSASVLSSFIGASLIRASQGSTNVNLISLQVHNYNFIVLPDRPSSRETEYADAINQSGAI